MPTARKIKTAEEFKAATGGSITPPPRLVISDWLHLCRAGQWTPFEGAGEIMKRLRDAGYQIVLEKK